jgi:hypothetical protein
VWCAPFSLKRLESDDAPIKQTQFEFTFDNTNQLYFDVTFVEAVSEGGIMAYYNRNGSQFQTTPAVYANAVPSSPDGYSVVRGVNAVTGANIVLSNKWTETDPVKKYLAACPSEIIIPGVIESGAILADTPCGQHRCRTYYKQLYDTRRSYCNWIHDQADAYCWALDEWQCLDASCGYGGVNQPAQLTNNGLGTLTTPNGYYSGNGFDGCVIPDSAVVGGVGDAFNRRVFPANTYSCGFYNTEVSATPSPYTQPTTGHWWEIDGKGRAGCTEAFLGSQRKPLKVTSYLDKGNFVMIFKNLEWLTGRKKKNTTPTNGGNSAPPHPNDGKLQIPCNNPDTCTGIYVPAKPEPHHAVPIHHPGLLLPASGTVPIPSSSSPGLLLPSQSSPPSDTTIYQDTDGYIRDHALKLRQWVILGILIACVLIVIVVIIISVYGSRMSNLSTAFVRLPHSV